jgi:hypothetical protein
VKSTCSNNHKKCEEGSIGHQRDDNHLRKNDQEGILLIRRLETQAKCMFAMRVGGHFLFLHLSAPLLEQL